MTRPTKREQLAAMRTAPSAIARAQSQEGSPSAKEKEALRSWHPFTSRQASRSTSDSKRELSNLASYEVGLSNSTCAAKQPRRTKRSRPEKLSSRCQGQGHPAPSRALALTLSILPPARATFRD